MRAGIADGYTVVQQDNAIVARACEPPALCSPAWLSERAAVEKER
jgi:hypothetical protein